MQNLADRVGDTGLLVGGGFEGRVTDVIKQDGVFIHEVRANQDAVRRPDETHRDRRRSGSGP